VLAHRGARRSAPENTLEAFTRALEVGADGVELDVHRSADDELVVHHDADIPGVGVAAAVPLATIRAARPDVPTLGEALDACAGALVNIEIKNLPGDADFDATDRAADLVADLLARRDGADEVIVSSFNLATVDRVHAVAPGVATGFLTMHGLDPLAALDVCVARGHSALHPFIGMLAGNLAAAVTARAKELGVQVNTWTVNDDEEIRRLAGVGVDGIVTDVPGAALRALGRA
jgi:glycerophosphoryl diester phosphodiesterase